MVVGDVPTFRRCILPPYSGSNYIDLKNSIYGILFLISERDLLLTSDSSTQVGTMDQENCVDGPLKSQEIH